MICPNAISANAIVRSCSPAGSDISSPQALTARCCAATNSLRRLKKAVRDDIPGQVKSRLNPSRDVRNLGLAAHRTEQKGRQMIAAARFDRIAGPGRRLPVPSFFDSGDRGGLTLLARLPVGRF